MSQRKKKNEKKPKKKVKRKVLLILRDSGGVSQGDLLQHKSNQHFTVLSTPSPSDREMTTQHSYKNKARIPGALRMWNTEILGSILQFTHYSHSGCLAVTCIFPEPKCIRIEHLHNGFMLSAVVSGLWFRF